MTSFGYPALLVGELGSGPDVAGSCAWSAQAGEVASSPPPATEPGSAPRGPEASPAQPEPAARESPPGQLPPAWFHDHFERLWRLAARLGVPQHSVDDVVQEAFITASRRRADIHDGQERRFLISTVIKVSANYRRRACVRHELHGDAPDERASPLPGAERLLMLKRARELLDLALDGLTDIQRSVFVLYELEGFSVPEIAELEGIPTGTVASRLGRARAQFAEAVARLQRSGAAGTGDR